VIVLSDEPMTQISAGDRTKRGLPLGGPWQVAYGDEPAQSVVLPHIWEDERGREHYSGAASYTTTIGLGGVDGEAWIDFGDCSRFRMQDLDRAMESVRSGLLRVPTIVVSTPQDAGSA
jgi:hypothetical protein